MERAGARLGEGWHFLLGAEQGAYRSEVDRFEPGGEEGALQA